jgi:uncharacterized protein (TIGR02271 family)
MEETRPSTLQVIDQNGVRAVLDLTVVPPQGAESRLVLVRFDDGTSAFADASVFVEQQPSVFFFPGNFADLRRQNEQPLAANQTVNETPAATQADYSPGGNTVADQGEGLVIPVLAEQLQIARQQVVTGGVRVRKTVHERVETIDQPVMEEHVDVERVAINRFIDQAPAVRYEGDVMVVPLLEEVIVVEKRLVCAKKSEFANSARQLIARNKSFCVAKKRRSNRLTRTQPKSASETDRQEMGKLIKT